MNFEESQFNQIRFPTNLLFYSLAVYVSAVPLSLLFFNHSPFGLDYSTATLFEKALFYTTIMAAFAISTALILISFELENLPHNLYGFLKPFRYAMLSLSLIFMIAILSIVNLHLAKVPLIIALSILVAMISEVLIILSYSINCLLLSLIFMFIVFRDPVQPIQSSPGLEQD